MNKLHSICYRFVLVVGLSGLVCITGCWGPNIEVVDVSGTVTQDGKPLAEVKVIFSPNPATIPKEELARGRGQPSQAITDENGKYRLKYRGDLAEFGAEVGSHLITAIDVLAENSRDNPIPPRIDQKYSIASQTDIEFEVKTGEEGMVFDFELENRK